MKGGGGFRESELGLDEDVGDPDKMFPSRRPRPSTLSAHNSDRVHETDLTFLDAEFVAVGNGGEVDEHVDRPNRLVDHVATIHEGHAWMEPR